MKNYLELLKVLPKTNCGECGLSTCLLFALKVFGKEISPEKCPYFPKELLPQEASQESSKVTFNQLLENLKFLKEKFRTLNLKERCENLGGEFLEEKGAVKLFYLDTEILIPLDSSYHPLEILELSQTQRELDPRDEILICNYFIFNGKAPLSQEFVGLESFPHSISKVKTLKKYAEEPLAEFFTEFGGDLQKLLEPFRISNLNLQSDHLSFVVWVLPRVPLQITFWRGDEEEGLPSSCKVLYNASALSYLDLECLVFCAERFAEKLRELQAR